MPQHHHHHHQQQRQQQHNRAPSSSSPLSIHHDNEHQNNEHQNNQRPLRPPFPNGSCGGTVITLPRNKLFPGLQGSGSSSGGIVSSSSSSGSGGSGGDGSSLPFLNLNLNLPQIQNPFSSSLENAVLPPRDVKVWLPKEYSMREYRKERFPILYCHDGQNAIEDTSSWTGSSWRLIGALTRLHERNLLNIPTPPIVVCIPCADGDIFPGISRRHSEYGDYTHPISMAHADFVATKLHPYVMQRFRVKSGVEHTCVMGSSLGGQASLQLVLRYPAVFGGAACLSPCFQPGTIAAVVANLVTGTTTNTNDTVKGGVTGAAGAASTTTTTSTMSTTSASHGTANNGTIHKSSSKRRNNVLKENQNRLQNSSSAKKKIHTVKTSLHSKMIYMDNGGDVEDTRVPVFEALDHFTLNERWWNPGYWWLDTSLQPMIDAMRWTLDQAGVNYTYEKFPGGRHNERAWAQRIHRPLLALYGKKGLKG